MIFNVYNLKRINENLGSLYPKEAIRSVILRILIGDWESGCCMKISLINESFSIYLLTKQDMHHTLLWKKL